MQLLRRQGKLKRLPYDLDGDNVVQMVVKLKGKVRFELGTTDDETLFVRAV